MSVLLGSAATAGLNASALGLTFCNVPAGTYEVGAEDLDDNPVRKVETGALDLAETPTTNRQFAAGLRQLENRTTVLMTELPKHRWGIVARGTVEELRGVKEKKLMEALAIPVPQKASFDRLGDRFILGGLLSTFDLGGLSARIVPVTLEALLPKGFASPKQPALTGPFEASAFAALFGLALPTGVEWEIAAGNLRDEKYREEKELRKVAHSRFAETTVKVKTKAANNFGFYDMLGNVWEAMANPCETGKEAREFRGGCCVINAVSVRATLLDGYNPSSWNYHLGFRLLRPQD